MIPAHRTADLIGAVLELVLEGVPFDFEVDAVAVAIGLDIGIHGLAGAVTSIVPETPIVRRNFRVHTDVVRELEWSHESIGSSGVGHVLGDVVAKARESPSRVEVRVVDLENAGRLRVRRVPVQHLVEANVLDGRIARVGHPVRLTKHVAIAHDVRATAQAHGRSCHRVLHVEINLDADESVRYHGVPLGKSVPVRVTQVGEGSIDAESRIRRPVGIQHIGLQPHRSLRSVQTVVADGRRPLSREHFVKEAHGKGAGVVDQQIRIAELAHRDVPVGICERLYGERLLRRREPHDECDEHASQQTVAAMFRKLGAVAQVIGTLKIVNPCRCSVPHFD